MPPPLPESLRLLLPDGTVRMLLVEDYLRGVVAAALAPDAPLEAMKALSVAARTFAAGTHRHLDQNADVCTLRHCQAWNERANPRASRAVIETRSTVATFDDKLIEAFYFEHCDGKTRDAQGVLLNAPAYLKSVSCQCGFAAKKGHGIGMCLRGMLVMARSGDPYDLILRHYYSQVVLVRAQVETSTTTGEHSPKASTVTPPAARIMPVKPIVRPETKHLPAAPLAGSASDVPPTTADTPEKPARKTPAPRRAARKKIEQTPPTEQPPVTLDKAGNTQPVTSAPTGEAAVLPTTPLVAFDDARSAEADDLLLFLAVEDARPAPGTRPPLTEVKPPPQTTAPETDTSFLRQFTGLEYPPPAAASTPPPVSVTPPSAFAPPPPSMPEEMPDALDLEMFAAPPVSMPEDVPNASELDFLAPPVASSIEPDLADFVPPVEKFYTPLDAPPTFPEALPTFQPVGGVEETPFSWVPPPPMEENAFEVKQPQVLMDALPGPRIIAGNLKMPGMLVTIRDARGNSIVTVSGVAKQYGVGGFEAPLTDDGAYHVKFDGTEVDVRIENETVFLYYG